MKNGFTLIELLAVITVLAIILLIAFPIFTSVIKDSKKTSEKDSINLYGRAAEQAIATYFVNYPEEDYVTFEKIEKLIQYKGSKVECNKKYIIDREVFLSECSVNDNLVEETYGRQIKNMLVEVPEDESGMFLNTNIESKKISKFNISIDGNFNKSGYESKDCSYNGDKSVMCYWKKDALIDEEGYYEMNLVSNGEIYTPFNSDYLFFKLGQNEVQSLDFTGINTKYTVNMNSMFALAGAKRMKDINLGNQFDTSNVTGMSNMFANTGNWNMTSLSLGDKFDTSNVKDMRSMFWCTGQEKMTYLDLGRNFTIPSNAIMGFTFNSCGKNSIEMRVYVGNQTIKNQLLSLNLQDIPEFWKTNNNIIVVH